MTILATSRHDSLRALVAFTALISAVCTAAELPRVVEKPIVAIGENWTYAGHQNGQKFLIKFEIEKLNDTEIHAIITLNGDAALAKPQVFDRQWNPLEARDNRNRLIKYSPYLPTFRFPLQIGESWTKNYEWHRNTLPDAETSNKPRSRTWKEVQDQTSGDNRTLGGGRVEARILDWENITVPAGTYDTIKVELLSPHYAGSETKRIFGKKEMVGGEIQLYWYSPKIKRYIKHLYRLYVNEKLVTSVDLDLIEYNEAEVASTKDKEKDPPRQHKSESQELLDAIERGNGERALTLLKQGVDPNTKDALGRTALMYAGINGQTKIIMPALLDKGADANAKSLDGTTALIAAVIFSDPDAVRLLLRHGADMNARDNNGNSALDWAVIRLRTAPSDRSLLNFRERNSNGDLTMATAKEVQEVIEVLKAAGVKE